MLGFLRILFYSLYFNTSYFLPIINNQVQFHFVEGNGIGSLARDSRSSSNCTLGFFCTSSIEEPGNEEESLIDYDLFDVVTPLKFPLNISEQNDEGM